MIKTSAHHAFMREVNFFLTYLFDKFTSREKYLQTHLMAMVKT